jgi:hypothetical protein
MTVPPAPARGRLTSSTPSLFTPEIWRLA